MSAFTVFEVDSPKAIRTFKKNLEDKRSHIGEMILSGQPTDWADYKRLVGVLQGIDEALRVCDDLEKEAEERR
jgi:hypothetical protein